jgi:hypothetical protein
MTDLIKDYYQIIESAKEIQEVLRHLKLEDIKWSDDDGNLNAEYKRNNPFVSNLLNTAQFLIANNYLDKYYKTVSFSESKLIQGVTKNVVVWHNDRLSCLDEIEKGTEPDHNILCLFYFNTMEEGGISIWNKASNEQVYVKPTNGQLVLLNETNPNIFHKVENYDKSIKRYIARFSYFVKDPYEH